MKYGLSIGAIALALGGVAFETYSPVGSFLKTYQRTPEMTAKAAVRSDHRLAQLDYSSVCGARPRLQAGQTYGGVHTLITANKPECGQNYAIARFETNIGQISRTVFVIMPRDAANERLVTTKKPALAL